MLRGPIQRAREPRAAVQLTGVAISRVPVGCRCAQVGVHSTPGPVFFEPRAIPRPFAQQCLVRKLYLPIADGQQASVGQLGKDRASSVDAVQLGGRYPAANERSILPAGQP